MHPRVSRVCRSSNVTYPKLFPNRITCPLAGWNPAKNHTHWGGPQKGSDRGSWAGEGKRIPTRTSEWKLYEKPHCSFAAHERGWDPYRTSLGLGIVGREIVSKPVSEPVFQTRLVSVPTSGWIVSPDRVQILLKSYQKISEQSRDLETLRHRATPEALQIQHAASHERRASRYQTVETPDAVRAPTTMKGRVLGNHHLFKPQMLKDDRIPLRPVPQQAFVQWRWKTQ